MGSSARLVGMSPERTRQLHEAVSALVERLRSEEEEDVDRALPELERLHRQLESLLAQEAPPPSLLTKQLRAAVDRFEARHPRTALMVGRIADSLSEMGL